MKDSASLCLRVDPGLARAVLQFARFAVVGLLSNGLLFAFYLVATSAGLGPKLAATTAYAIGVLFSFHFNRSWTFVHKGIDGSAFVRHVVVYGVGYVLNLGALLVLVDYAGLPHRWVQGTTIMVVAVLLFVAQKWWVYPEGTTR